eukprot:754592-Amphidinium_carterae.1
MREVGSKPLTLFNLPFFSSDAALQKLAEELAQSPKLQENRYVVPYISGPGGYGKTSSIWPAFRESTVLDLYIYLPFDNNGMNHHEGPTIQEIQGLLFVTTPRAVGQPADKYIC